MNNLKMAGRWVVLGVVMLATAAWASGAVEERRDGVVSVDAQNAPKWIDWGPEVAGTRVALELGNATLVEGKFQPMDAWVYVMNGGNSTISFDNDLGDLKGIKFFTKNETSDLMPIGLPVGDGSGSFVWVRLPPNWIYRFSVRLSQQILREVKRQLYAGVRVGRMEDGRGSGGMVYSNGEPLLVDAAATTLAAVPEAAAPTAGEGWDWTGLDEGLVKNSTASIDGNLTPYVESMVKQEQAKPALVSAEIPSTAANLTEPRIEGVTLTMEGNSLTTGEAVTGNWTGWRGNFNVALVAAKESTRRMRIGGAVIPVKGGYRVNFNMRETAPVDGRAADGGKILAYTRNAWVGDVLMQLGESVQVLEGSGGNLTLTLTKTTIPRSKGISINEGGDWSQPQVWRQQNVRLIVQGKLPQGSPFKVAMVTGASWMTLDAEVPVGETATGVVQRTGLSIYAMLTPTAEGDRLDFKVFAANAVRVMGAVGSDAPDYTFKTLGSNSSVELKLGVPTTVKDANLGNLTFTLEPVTSEK